MAENTNCICGVLELDRAPHSPERNMGYHSTSFTTLTLHHTRLRGQSPAVLVSSENVELPSLDQLQANRSLTIAEEQAFVGKDGMVPGFVVEHRQP